MGDAISVSLIVSISIAVIVFLISVIISIKFGKKTSFNAEHKDNSFGFSIESDNQTSLEQKESKKEILQQLSRFGITEEFLFTDDKDKVLKDIVAEQKKRYME